MRVEEINTCRPRGTDEVKLMPVIRTISLIGNGTEKDPARQIYQYWDINGELLASYDTWKDAN